MTAMPHNMADRVDLYLDGLLSPPERAEFERALTTDASLRRMVDLQGEIDGKIKGMFTPPTDPGVVDLSAAPASIPFPTIAKARSKPWLPLAIAAALVLVSGVMFIVLRGGTGSATMTAVQALVVLETGGFKPAFVCKDDAEFAEVTKKKLGTPLIVAQAPGLKVLGWAYAGAFESPIISDRTMVLLCEVDGKHTLVFMDKASTTAQPALGDDSTGQKLFERTVGGVRLWELTPLDAPRVLDQFRVVAGV